LPVSHSGISIEIAGLSRGLQYRPAGRRHRDHRARGPKRPKHCHHPAGEGQEAGPDIGVTL